VLFNIRTWSLTSLKKESRESRKINALFAC
jgi:hypothetical protein